MTSTFLSILYVLYKFYLMFISSVINRSIHNGRDSNFLWLVFLFAYNLISKSWLLKFYHFFKI